MDNTTFYKMNKGIKIADNSNATLTNCVFRDLEQFRLLSVGYSYRIWRDGGGIEIENSNVSITNTTIDKCVGINGGGISIKCDYTKKCNIEMTNVDIKNSWSQGDGGGIIYNSYRPVMNNVTFSNNTATYGDDVASFPAKVKQIINGSLVELTEISGVPSGKAIDEPMTFAVVDEDDQILTSLKNAIIQFRPNGVGASLSGEGTVSILNGQATFTQTVFQSEPGKTEVPYLLYSDSIDYDKIQYMDPVKYADQEFTIDFRFCKPGEAQSGDI